MPLIQIKFSTPHKQAAHKGDIAAAANRLSADILHKDPRSPR